MHNNTSDGKCSTSPGAKLSGGRGVERACKDRARLGIGGGGGGGACPARSDIELLLLAPGPELLALLTSSSGLVSLSNEFL